MHEARRKILVVSVTPKSVEDAPRGLSMAVRVLRMLGWRFATVSDALAAREGKYACLTVDGAARSGLYTALGALGIPATLFVAASELAAAPDSWSELAAASEAGWEVGCAGLSRLPLTELSYGEQLDAIVSARKMFEDHLGHPPRIFSYPFGAYDTTTVSCVKDAGFAAAVTLRAGVNAAAGDPYQLRRLALAPAPIRAMTAVVKHALAPVPKDETTVVTPGSRRRVRTGVAS